MPFTNRDFPGRAFNTIGEYEEACRLRSEVEKSLVERAAPPKIIAQILPAGPDAVERRLASLEHKIETIVQRMTRKKSEPTEGQNREGIPLGTVLVGESQGQSYSLEVLEDNYLCSNGYIYESLSGAAQGVSGNRRSGWKFWRGSDGRTIGEIMGRFDAGAEKSYETV